MTTRTSSETLRGDFDVAAVSYDWPDFRESFDDLCPSIPTLNGEEFAANLLGTNDPEDMAIVHFVLKDEPASKYFANVLQRVARNGWSVFNIDCADPMSAPVAERFAIGAVPTLLLFRGGKLVARYPGSGDHEEIGQWAAHYDRLLTA